ncbi:MAG: tRNA lysidine(34) synthetase TilS [Comamonadaceae bacterium]|nr:tRNA lysidine(34) synthetase TilS [Comamonadaceae bacterium]
MPCPSPLAPHHPADPAQVDAALAAWAASRPALPLGVAFSGGADSTALLLACAARWPGQVVALHVHHGLQDAADGFERHCARLCARLKVPLRVQRVNARHAPGDSPEATARARRYEALAAMAQESPAADGLPAVQTIALAQHADDQVETVLLALSRGAGLPGLAAMPAHWRRGRLAYARPLLGVPGAALRAWLQARGEDWVEDPSNASPRFTRNRIRSMLLPALEAALPAFRTTFARSAAHAAQAQQVLAEVAAQDLAACGVPPAVARIQAFSRPRQANLLRHWLSNTHNATPSSAQLTELLDQIAACTTRGHRLHLKVGRGFVQRQGDSLAWIAPA